MVYWSERIWVDPAIMGGVPCIKGTRIPVATIVKLIAQGETPDEVAQHYPQIELEDVRAALVVAAEMITDSALLGISTLARARLSPVS
jgi:uncharacterized protein (DUF433 family)